MPEPAPSRRLAGGAVCADPLVRELLDARLVCVLATFDVGFVHAVPMWFAHDGEAIFLATGSRSRKVANLERDPSATFVLHDSRPGFEVCGISIAGQVDIVKGPEAGPLVDQVHRRYLMERPDEPEAVREFLASDDVALRLSPESALTWDERGSAASEALRATSAALPLMPTTPRP